MYKSWTKPNLIVLMYQEEYRQLRLERAEKHRRAALLHKLDIKAQVLDYGKIVISPVCIGLV